MKSDKNYIKSTFRATNVTMQNLFAKERKKSASKFLSTLHFQEKKETPIFFFIKRQ